MGRPVAAAIVALWMVIFFNTRAHEAGARPADMLLYNGRFHTMNDRQQLASMVAVVGERIVHVGGAGDVDEWRGNATRLIDLEGLTVVPGLIESHGHLLAIGHARMMLDLSGAESYPELVRQVASAVETTPHGQWILGTGWHQSKWDPPPDTVVKGFPVHQALSRVSPSHPVFLTHASGHAGLANAMAMTTAGITPQTEVDGDGEIIRGGDGTPTGVFTERAQGLIRRAIPEATQAQNRQALSLAISEALQNGITSFRDAGSGRETIDLYRSFLSEGRLGVRLWVMVDGSDGGLVEEWLEKGPEIDSGNRFLTIRAFKLFADGALGSRGAWLLSSYADRPGHFGHHLVPMEDLYRLSTAALKRGFSSACMPSATGPTARC